MIPNGQALLQDVIAGLLLGGFYALAALGLSLTVGVMRVINILHGDLMVLSAFLASVLMVSAHLDPLLAIFIIAPALFIFGYPFQRFLLTPIMNRGQEGPLVITLACSMILESTLLLIFSGNPRVLTTSYSLVSWNLPDGIVINAVYVIAFALGIVLLSGLHLVLTRTSIGKAIRATSEDPSAAQMLGINIRHTYAVTFGLAAATAAVPGVLLGLLYSFTPTDGTTYLLIAFVVVVIGGLGSLAGTLVAGIFIGIAQSVGSSVVGSGYYDMIGFVLALIMMVARPTGLFGRRRV
jgi:branched-chain amino acid transport system permease protein